MKKKLSTLEAMLAQYEASNESTVNLKKLPLDYDELTSSERREVRLEYVLQQKNLCFHCQCDLSKEPPKHITDKPINWDLFPQNFLKHPIHLQHDHYTGLTEGAVHSYCNAVMWQYEGK